MKRKVQDIARELSQRISRWEGVEAILLGEAADIETFDPYFTIDLDIYYRGDLPRAQKRKVLLPDALSFTSLSGGALDRFLMEDMPVSLHYIEAARIDLVLSRIMDENWAFREHGTTMFYRIERGQVLHLRGEWLDSVRAKIAEFPEDFWRKARTHALDAAERSLSELSAAVFRSDALFYLISASRLAKSICSYLFARNRRFEPSGRMLSEQVRALPELPDGFEGRFESILRPGGELSLEAKREVAELLVRSIIAMG